MFDRNRKKFGLHRNREIENIHNDLYESKKITEDSLIQLIEEGKLPYDSKYFRENPEKPENRANDKIKQPEREPGE